MQSILDAINEWIKEILIGAINGNLSTMFGDVNEKVGTIAAEVGQTPQGWNAGIFSMIRTLSENVIVPIAGLVITYVLCYELISMVTEKNNMHDVDTSMFFKWVFKKDLFREEKPSIGKCPRCGSPVHEGKKNYYCSNRECAFVMWKNDRFFEERKTAFSAKIAAALLKSGKANVKKLYSPKTGKTYDGTIVLADTGGKYVNYRIEVQKN